MRGKRGVGDWGNNGRKLELRRRTSERMRKNEDETESGNEESEERDKKHR